MEKISAIVPTLQKNLKVLNKLLGLLIRDESVSEIIVINNAKEPFVPVKEIYGSEKLRIYNQEKNLFVNPSWNLGISLCKNDRFFMTNDDILYCENFCTKVLQTGILEKEDTGLVGLYNGDMKSFSADVKDIDIPKASDGVFLLKMENYMGTGDWGSGFFGKKENYYEVPEELKVIYGDNYILYKNLLNNKINYQISGVKFNHIHSLSSASSEVSAEVTNDITVHKRFFTEPLPSEK